MATPAFSRSENSKATSGPFTSIRSITSSTLAMAIDTENKVKEVVPPMEHDKGKDLVPPLEVAPQMPVQVPPTDDEEVSEDPLATSAGTTTTTMRRVSQLTSAR